MREYESGRVPADVLGMLASAAALPPVTDVDVGHSEEPRLPDIDDNDPFWIILYWAAQRDAPEQADDEWFPIMAVFAPGGMGKDEMWENVYAAAGGEFDEDVPERCAAAAWTGRGRRL